MQTSLANSIRWPIKDHLRDAIDLLETWHNSGGRPDALPLECRDERWASASVPCTLLTRLALEQELSTAVLGFPGSPGMLALRWLLETARLGQVSWKNLKLTDPEFARLIAAAGRLGETQVVFDPGPWASVEELYARATWTVREFGVARIAFWEWALSTGLPLSIAPQPWGWFD